MYYRPAIGNFGRLKLNKYIFKEKAIDPDVLIEKGLEIVLTFGPKLVAAIVVLIIGSWVVRGIIGTIIKE